MSDPSDERERRVRAYYRALDTHDYERLAELLHPSFVHDRPDMTVEGRDRFVAFMREERPLTETSHPLDGVYEQGNGDELAARGRLLDADGNELTAFVDVFSFEGTDVRRIQTFTN